MVIIIKGIIIKVTSRKRMSSKRSKDVKPLNNVIMIYNIITLTKIICQECNKEINLNETEIRKIFNTNDKSELRLSLILT